MGNLIEVTRLRKYFSSGIFRKVRVKAVDGISFEIRKGETFGLVGESGCGKTTLGRCILRLLEPTSGEVRFKGENILMFKGQELKDLRRKMQVVFQDTDGTLDPRKRVQTLLTEPLRVHGLLQGKATQETYRLLEMVNLSPDLLVRFPHELSGGQRQRIGIARALSLTPDFMVADEPAASLDLSVQAQILDLMKQLQEEFQLSYLLISHNLRVVKLLANRIAVMYLGKFVEVGEGAEVLAHPAHPYTKALLSALPSRGRGQKRIVLQGEPPSPLSPPVGCPFHPRCPYAQDICREKEPELREVTSRHSAACHLAEKL